MDQVARLALEQEPMIVDYFKRVKALSQQEPAETPVDPILVATTEIQATPDFDD